MVLSPVMNLRGRRYDACPRVALLLEVLYLADRTRPGRRAYAWRLIGIAVAQAKDAAQPVSYGLPDGLPGRDLRILGDGPKGFLIESRGA
jgi:hypothetical protein